MIQSRVKVSLIGAIPWLILLFILSQAGAALGQAIVQTDSSDYLPGETVLITGAGFDPAESVQVQVTHLSGISGGEGHDPWMASASAEGGFITSWVVPFDDNVGETLLVTAVGQISGLTATTTFTDAPPAGNLDQVRNGTVISPIDPPNWVNGNLNASQSHYVEGHSIPYRLVLTNLGIGAHNVKIEWDIKHSDKQALDYITHYQRLLPHDPSHPAESVNPLQGLSGSFSAPNHFAIPAPSSAGSPVLGQPTASFNALPGGERVMTIYNGTISSMSYVSEGSLTDAQSATQLSINFNADSSTVVLAWGGHIASRIDWGFFPAGSPRSAAAISGSPYHTRFIELDNKGGNQDRSLQADAVAPPCLISGPDTVCGGTTNVYTAPGGIVSYSWLISGDGTISGSTTNQSVTVLAGPSGTYTLTVSVTQAGVTSTCNKSVTVNTLPSCTII